MKGDARIAILTQFAPSQHAGGVEVFNDCLQRALGGVEIFADGGPEDRVGGLRRVVGLEQPAEALRAARALLRRHRAEPFDLILSNGLFGWPLTLARPGVPLVEVYHCTMAGFANHVLSLRSERFAQGRVMAFFDRMAGIGKHVVGVSHRVLREVEAFYGLKGRLMPHSVDTRTFRPMNADSARDTLGLPHGTPIGLFVGRPDYTKGFDILTRVAGLMPDVLFLVVGGQHEGALGNVRSLGRIAHEDLATVYAASDFFFLPSRYEGFGLSTLEALSSDLPVVVSEEAWPFPEEPSQCGVVVRGTREDEFAAGIRLVLESRSQFSPRAFVLPRFDFTVFQGAWREFIASVIGAGS